MKRNVVIALLVVIAMALWRIHVHHAQVVSSSTKPALHAPVTAHAGRAAPHGGSIAGTVRDETGAPIAGARVCADATSLELPGDMVRDPRCVQTRATGAYAISNLYAADYQVAAMAKQFIPETYAPNGPDKAVLFPVAANEDRRGIDLVLRRGGVEVAGTVSDIGGGAVAGARVRVDGTGQRYGTGSIVVETDDRGHYSAWTRSGSVSLTADAEGYAPTSRPITAPAETNLVLVPESILSGTVVDATSGKPLADITVGAIGAENTWISVDTTLTDAQGRFTIPRLAPGRYIATARAAHGTGTADGSAQLGLGQRVDDVVVRLHPAHQIVAHVIADGKPCKTAWLGLVDEHQGLQPDVIRDADGTLHADGVMPGTYLPSPGCEGFTGASHYDPIVVTDRDVATTLAVEPGATITGRVRTQSGAPVAYADINAWGVTTTERIPRGIGGDRTTRTGDYEIHGLRPGRYQLSVSRSDSNGMGPPVPDVMVDVGVATTVKRDLVVPDAGSTITGRVTTPTGSPGRVFVQVRGSDGSTSVASDDAGRYEFHDIAPGSYELVVSGATDHGLHDNLIATPTKIVVRAGEPTTANLVVELLAGVIRGRVVDERGAPISDAFVGLAFEHDAAPALSSARGDSDELLAGNDGRFVAEHLSSGLYTVRAYRKGGGDVVAAHVALGSDLTLVLKSTADVTGIARRPGPAIDDLHVSVFDRETEERLRDETFFRTGGKFAVRDLPAGHYRVVVATGGSEHVRQLDLAEGEHATLEVALEGNVVLTGRAVDARTGKPVAGIQMSATLVHLNTSFMTPADMRDTSDAAGRFEIPNVARGELEISGRTLELDGRMFEAATFHRIVKPSDPDVIDVGDVLIVTSTSNQRGDTGLWLDATGDPAAVHVVGVSANSPADRAGIVVGDVITAIDGVDVGGDTAREAPTLVDGDIGKEVKLTLARGETVTVALAKL